MKRSLFSLIVVGLLALAVPAFATPQCPGVGNDCSQDTTTVNQGGAGGQGGVGIGGVGIGGGASVHTTNTNVNVNDLSNRNSQGQGQQQGQKQGQIQGQGQKQAIKDSANNTNIIEGDHNPAQAPAVFAPGLAVAPETCMGSTSVGGSAGFASISLGVSVGSTWKSESCERRMFARALQQLGPAYTLAAVALLAQDENVKRALEDAGIPVPGAKKTEVIEEPKKTSAVDAQPTMAALAPSLPVSEVLGAAMVRRLEDNKASVQAN